MEVGCLTCRDRGFYFTRVPGPGNNRVYKKHTCKCGKKRPKEKTR